MSEERFRANQLAMLLTASLIFTAFTLVLPFLPFFLVSLGMEDPSRVAVWTGILLTVSPLLAALLGPFWGRLADRYGLKIMAQRVLLTMTVTWALTAFVRNHYELLFLRVLLGLFSGFGTISVALITQGCTQQRIGRVVGRLQSVQILSAAAGPFIGGLLANWIGIRATFLVTAALCGAAFLMIGYLYRDEPVRQAAGDSGRGEPEPRMLLRDIISMPGFFPVLVLMFATAMVDRSFSAVLPILVDRLSSGGISPMTAAGLVMSAGWFTAAGSAWFLGRWATTGSMRILIAAGLVLGSAFTLPMAFVNGWIQLLILRCGLGFAVGGIMTLAYTIGGGAISRSRSTSFAILGSASLLGGAVGPMVSGLLAGRDLALPFILNAGLYVLLAVWTVAMIRVPLRQKGGPSTPAPARLLIRD
ncbi:MAG: MFS transporter [Acidobacteriota bacterium]